MSKATGIPCGFEFKPLGRRVACFEALPMTAREVRIAREAFVAGQKYEASPFKFIFEDRTPAEEHYPLPKIARPREVEIATGGLKVGQYAERGRYRVEDGFLKKLIGAGWQQIDGISPQAWSAEGLATLADLYANPTEEVDAE